MTWIITRADLQGRTLEELQAVQLDLAAAECGSEAWHDALVSLETISMAIAQRRMRGPGF